MPLNERSKEVLRPRKSTHTPRSPPCLRSKPRRGPPLSWKGSLSSLSKNYMPSTASRPEQAPFVSSSSSRRGVVAVPKCYECPTGTTPLPISCDSVSASRMARRWSWFNQADEARPAFYLSPSLLTVRVVIGCAIVDESLPQ